LSGTSPRRKKSQPALDAAASQGEIAGLSVTPELYLKFQRLIHQEAGIWLGDSRAALLCGRLSRRLRALKLSSLDQYYELVLDPRQGEERIAMIDAMTTNETRFFRDPRHFEFLEARAIPRWRSDAQQGLRSKKMRLWSAGCSSGEEPYSLAMLLARHLPAEQGWDVTILATDLSTRMLAHARTGIYSITKAVDIPEPLLKDHMLKGIDKQSGQMKVMPQIQDMVEFRKLNLNRDPFPQDALFDAIFCRNVLIYFDAPSRQKTLEQLIRCLARTGILFLGQAENLSSFTPRLRTLVPAAYARDGEHSGY
jgi:chemotaxis protein methyltransferase CheR